MNMFDHELELKAVDAKASAASAAEDTGRILEVVDECARMSQKYSHDHPYFEAYGALGQGLEFQLYTIRKNALECWERTRQLNKAQASAEAYRALMRNKCPRCGWNVQRNLAFTGWVQCSQFGAEEFRASDEWEKCSWQGFAG